MNLEHIERIAKNYHTLIAQRMLEAIERVRDDETRTNDTGMAKATPSMLDTRQKE